MRKLIRLAAKLYPPDWRRRYGGEFEALLEHAGASWRDVLDVVKGAMMMQISTWSSRSVTVACGLVGLILAAGWAFSLPNVYVSRALIRVTPSQIPENLVPATYNQQMADRISLLWQSVVSRVSLSELIQRPTLNLYKSERAHKPLEDVIEQMKSEDIKIEILGNKSGVKPSSAFLVSFHYPDPIVAQKTTSALVAKLIDANQIAAQNDGNRNASATLDILDSASLPKKPTAPNRRQIELLGFAGGALVGIVIALLRRKSPA